MQLAMRIARRCAPAAAATRAALGQTDGHGTVSVRLPQTPSASGFVVLKKEVGVA